MKWIFWFLLKHWEYITWGRGCSNYIIYRICNYFSYPDKPCNMPYKLQSRFIRILLFYVKRPHNYRIWIQWGGGFKYGDNIGSFHHFKMKKMQRVKIFIFSYFLIPYTAFTLVYFELSINWRYVARCKIHVNWLSFPPSNKINHCNYIVVYK